MTATATPTGETTHPGEGDRLVHAAAIKNHAQVHGPLRIPVAPGRRVEVRPALTERLNGHTTSTDWLPLGLSHELDELRTNFVRLRERAAGDLHASEQTDRQHDDEDRKHQAAMQQALRDGEGVPEDCRRSPIIARRSARNCRSVWTPSSW